MNRTLWTLGFVLAISALPAAAATTLVVGPVVAPVLSGPPAFLHSGPSHPNASSSNWAGYAIPTASGAVKFVKGSWIQPTLSCTSATRYSSFWVGIDGYASSTVEQTGTEADCFSGSASYFAWYEFYPAFPVTITSVPIHPGDVLVASVTFVNTTVGFTIFLKDTTTGHSFSHSHKVTSAHRSSAEWIAEAPFSGGVLPLADFVKVKFGKDATSVAGTNEATISGHTHLIGGFPAASIVRINMTHSGPAYTKALTSALSHDGSSFNVTWTHA